MVGSIAGFEVFLADNFMNGPKVVLKGAATYIVRITDTAHGTIRQFEHILTLCLTTPKQLFFAGFSHEPTKASSDEAFCAGIIDSIHPRGGSR